jgi:hypothetical protein
MMFQPSAKIEMLVGGVVVDNAVNGLSGGNLLLDDIEKSDEFLVAMTLHVATDRPHC